MNHKTILTLVIFVMIAICVYAQTTPESEFTVERSSDGRSITITGYTGTRQVVNIPSTIQGLPVTEIGVRAFYQKKLTSVVIPNSIILISGSAFRENQLIIVAIPNSVTTIWNNAFLGNQLTSVTIPNSVTTIGSHAFFRNQLTSVTIPNSVTTIGDCAFSENQLIGNINIPASVTEIGGWSFCCNTGLNAINVASGNPHYSSADGVLYSKNGTALILYPGGKTRAVTIPKKVTFIGSGAFCGFQFTSITIPAGVLIVDGAFAGEIKELYDAKGRNAFYYENGIAVNISDFFYAPTKQSKASGFDDRLCGFSGVTGLPFFS